MHARDGNGFTLIEVLVALCVLALGVIGAAGMQLTALRTRAQSAWLSSGAQLAADMAERMHANVQQMAQPDASNPYLGVAFDAAADPDPGTPASLCYAPADCSGAQLASFDIYEWKQRILASLPGGRLSICRDSRVWDASRQALRWECDNLAGAPIVIKLGWRAKNPDGTAALDLSKTAPPSVALALAGVAP